MSMLSSSPMAPDQAPSSSRTAPAAPRRKRRGRGVAAVVGAVARLQHVARGSAEGLDARQQARARRVEPRLQRALGGGEGLGIVALDAGRDGVDAPFQDEVLRARLGRREPARTGGVQARGHVGAQLEQLGKAQQHQRHRVVAVEVGVEDQVRLVADARDQRAPVLERFARGCFAPGGGGAGVSPAPTPPALEELASLS
jgi:hypothetical protein